MQQLKEQVEYIFNRISSNEPAETFISKVTYDKFDYLAIGNSITQHPITDFWWTECGMAASRLESDYFHIVLKDFDDNANSGIFNYAVWESQSHDRTETYELLDKWLINGIDLITIQLSENATDLSTFKEDFYSLLKHIVSICPSAQIVVIDDFWSNKKHDIKEDVCSDLKIDFIDLSDIRGIDEYKAGLGTTVWDNDGNEHFIDHSGVANHPGDKAMQIIAERILERTKSKK